MGYRALSKYRAELMGLAMLWVMCFHAFDLDLGREWLNNLRGTDAQLAQWRCSTLCGILTRSA